MTNIIDTCPEFYKMYTTDLNLEVKNIIHSDVKLTYNKLEKLRNECLLTIDYSTVVGTDVISAVEEINYESALKDKILPWLHDFYKIKLDVKYQISCIMNFIQSKYNSSIIDDRKKIKVTNIIEVLNTILKELTIVNEYETVSDLVSGSHKMGPTLSSVVDDDDKNIKRIRKNVFIERAYMIAENSRRLCHFLHVMQKAVFEVRNFNSDYRKCESSSSPNDVSRLMFS